MPEPEHSHLTPAAEEHPQTDAQRGGEVQQPPAVARPVREIGGPTGPEPTRYGDWEKAGRCIDF
jgi:hypothetical protein